MSATDSCNQMMKVVKGGELPRVKIKKGINARHSFQPGHTLQYDDTAAAQAPAK